MLLQLSIKNYALIESLNLQPAAGLSVITGETGAGKSILLGALNLLLGQRNLGSKILLQETKKCVIEGVFDVSRYELESFFATSDIDYAREAILRRELLPEGRSRAFVNDTPVGLDFIRSLGERLIDVHSQHETLLLSKSNFQRRAIDSWAANQARLLSYKKAFSLHKEAKKEYETRQAAWTERQSQKDYTEYQLQETTSSSARVQRATEARRATQVVAESREQSFFLSAVACSTTGERSFLASEARSVKSAAARDSSS